MADLCLTLNGLWELQSSALSTPDTMSQQVHYLDKQGNMGHASETHDLAEGQVKMFLQFVNKRFTNWIQTAAQLHKSHYKCWLQARDADLKARCRSLTCLSFG